jgi:hypothetical protein
MINLPRAIIFALLLIGTSQAQNISKSLHFEVETRSSADQNRLPAVFKALETAYKDLKSRGLNPPSKVKIVIYPNLPEYLKTGAPFFELARANRAQNRISTQRIAALETHGGLEVTLRHELFHLAQPANWPRWKAEGSAFVFSGASSNVQPLQGLNESQLEGILSSPASQEMLNRAVATAVLWVKQGKK